MVTSSVRTSVGRCRGAAWRALALAWIGFTAVGCGADHLSPPPLADPDVLYWSVDFDHHAVTLSMVAPYDTATVTAIPHNHDGEVLAGLPAARYTSSDPERVLITSDGVLQAMAPTAQPVKITATLTAGNLKHTDEMLVRVIDGPPPPSLASFSIQPVPPDSAKIAAGNVAGNGGKTIVLNTLVKATDVTGAALPEQLEPFMDSFVEVPDLLVWFGVSDSTKVVLERIGSSPLGAISFRGSAPGKVTLYASTTAFGVTRVDTLPYRIGLPVWNFLVCCGDGPYSAQLAREVTVGTGAAIRWILGIGVSDITDSLSITFADPTNVAAARDISPSILESMGMPSVDALCALETFLRNDCGATGNIKLPAPKDAGSAVGGMRVFPVPGRYEFQEAVTGFRGTVIVVDER